MKRTIITFILAFTLIIPSMAEVNDPIGPYWRNQIELVCQKIGNHHNNEGIHRTPPQIPNVYFDASASTVYFENPCYECTPEEYKILRPQMFGAIKYNGQWRGVRFTE